MAVDAGLVGQLHHIRVDRHDPAVDAIELVDQRFDTVVMQMQLIHQLHNFRAKLLVFGFVLFVEAFIFIQGR